MGRLVLLLGGARSGKSAYAEQRGRELGGDRVLYVATSEPLDEEMRRRIAQHQARRPPEWRTLEAPRSVGEAIRAAAGDAQVILVDCLTVLVSNLLVQATGPYDDPFDDPRSDPRDEAVEEAIMREVVDIAACAEELDAEIIVVSNEVGMGLVPPYELSRAYRDVLGRANQVMARLADEVYLLVAGIPVQVR
jgi:adenosylcobinamide kinase/adenosylcobinamide-phosphate guanylyltransferase